MNISISQGTIEEVIAISHRIPEFKDPYPLEEYHQRLKGRPHLILKAACEGQDVGFKVGYALDSKVFYTWFGGILPAYRKHGIARDLATEQENWARSEGFTTIRLKTRNYLKPMLIFALKSGFYISEIQPKPDLKDHRIVLLKSLT